MAHWHALHSASVPPHNPGSLWEEIGLATASLQLAGLGHPDPNRCVVCSAGAHHLLRPMAHIMHAIQATAGRQ